MKTPYFKKGDVIERSEHQLRRVLDIAETDKGFNYLYEINIVDEDFKNTGSWELSIFCLCSESHLRRWGQKQES